tara:strand:- start:43 stop:231 length:189 start_codon:yes stop_codon:yes gene_type:complete
MNLKRSSFSLHDKNKNVFDNSKDYSTLKDLMKEQGLSTDLADHWDKERTDNQSNFHCKVYED